MTFLLKINWKNVVAASDTGILKINLSAIKLNWRLVKNFVGESVECAAVVKADAYGVGVNQVAPALFNEGCRHFFVVTLQEAEQVRALLGEAVTIYLLSGLKSEDLGVIEAKKIIPVLYHLSAIKLWSDYCARQQCSLPCVIKIDTGMTRLGLSSLEEMTQFVQHNWQNLNPILLMSHMACADEPEHELNRKQLESFQSAIKKFQILFPQAKYSLANSSATFLGKSYHFNMVRIGAALYGINPQPKQLNKLQPVIGLKLPVLQNRLLNETCSIGYGAKIQKESGSRVVVVAGGYADGVHRILARDAVGMIGDETVGLLGRISMDSCVFDITTCTNQSPEYVEVINETLTLDVLIQRNQNLGYEILTGLGKRFFREYL